MRLAALLVLAVAACAPPRRPELSKQELAERSRAFTERAEELRERLVETVLRRLAAERKAYAETGGPPPALDILVLSGGGQYGAFGAGVLEGWGSVDRGHPLARPRFDVVTGISTGALIAPYALSGKPERYEQIVEVYESARREWAELRDVLFFLPSRPSFLDNERLLETIRMRMDRRLCREVAAAHDEHRLLLVGATDLDLGRLRLFELGTLCRTEPLARVHEVLAAAIAIPAAFPPIEIGGALYVDGGVIDQVFAGTDPDVLRALASRWRGRFPGEPTPPLRYWVVINNKTRAEPRTVQPRWPEVADRSLDTLIHAQIVRSLDELALLCRLVARELDLDVQVRWIAIPDGFETPDGDAFFDPKVTVPLADLGRRLGADPASWRPARH